MARIISVEKVGDDLFTIVVANGSETCRSACRLEMADASGGGVVRKMEFESDEFQRLIMMGDINVKEISKAIELASR